MLGGGERWACELPTHKVPADNSWPSYVRVVREWMEFGAEYGVSLLDSRDRLKALLGAYSVHRSRGPLKDRFKASTWNHHMAILGRFYSWATDNGHATAVPFTYRYATGVFGGQIREMTVNQARRRQPKEHVTIKYLEEDFAELFFKGLARLQPDGSPERGYRGREMARNAAVGRFMFASGPRNQEFSYLLAAEVPALPARRTPMPLPFSLPWGITKGGKFRHTWIDYDTLAELHNYLAFERASAVRGSSWMPPSRWGEPLMVTEADALGGRVNGSRLRWEDLGPGERRRLVAPGGGSMLCDADAALALYLTGHEPLLVLRDLLGHSSALTTEKYLHRLDTTRIFAELPPAAAGHSKADMRAAEHEAAAEFDDEDDI
ncbi:integrase [Kitasatospora sp. MAP12-15]|uniref:site-specific integrase n=1 Tax=unclassified Kitasatospora TaxID=2633591 RepID=UPI0024749175|nr:site-specific integrase [Kitasatospora sp. MAP12-44]MDH6108176.1 integrase [Kitasatospora sp. MAP12-44]